MRIVRWPSMLSLSAVFLLLSHSTEAAPKRSKVLIYPTEGETIEQLEQRGIPTVKNYGSYWLVEADDQQVNSLKATHGDRAQKANYLNVIELDAVALDTSVGEPAVPGQLRQADPQGKRLRLVQFVGPVLPEWLAQVKAAGKVQVVSYIPNNAYVVWLDADAEQKLQNLTGGGGPIQWIGPYHPYYKLGRGLQPPDTQVVTVRISFVDDASAVETLQQIATFAIGKVEPVSTPLKQKQVRATVNSAAINALAQIPGVLWIEPVRPITARDEKQDLIVASVTNGAAFGPPPGVNYIDFLTNTVGFTNASAQYPLIDVADTGLDIGSNNPLHSDFYEGGPSTSNVLGGGIRSRVAYRVDYTSCPDEDHPDCNPCPDDLPEGEDCPPFAPYRNCPPSAHDGCGHGTFVTSVAVGFNDVPDITVPCVTRVTSTVCLNTNITVTPTQPQTVCVPTEPVETCLPVYLTNSWNTVGSSTNISVCADSTTLQTNDVPIVRQDADGFQKGMGVSPFGRIGVSKIFDDCCNDHVPNLTELVQTAYLNGSRIQNNSWGQILVTGSGGNDGVYDGQSQEYDVLVRDALPTGSPNPPTPGPFPLNQEMIVVFAGGNAGANGQVGGFGDVLVTPPATAKNVVSVGASENVRPDDGCAPFTDGSDNGLDISIFSSVGATEDGRFKPEIVAPGSSILAAQTQFQLSRFTQAGVTCAGPDPFSPSDPYNSSLDVQVIDDIYTCANGTSFSAPAVSGAMQLLWWYFQHVLVNEDGRNFLQPSPAMAKAYSCNAARYLPTTNPITGVRDTLPSVAQGMGILDLVRMFDGVPRAIRDQTAPRAIDAPLISTNPVNQQIYFSQTGQSYELSGEIASNDLPFRVTIAWTDAPGDPAAFPQLVNDLDLQVTVGTNTYKGNVFAEDHSIPGGAFDNLNNMESVFLPDGGAVTSGAPWRLVITAHALNGDGVSNVGNDTDQDFALVVYNAQTNTPPSDVPTAGTNDTCTAAVPISDFPYTFTNTLSKTVYHNTHPSPSCARGGVEAFWKVVQPTPGVTFTVDTLGSSFNTVVSIWKVQVVPQTIFVRGECGALVEVVCNNDANGTFQSALNFVADGSNTYYIVVEPHNNGDGGTLVLNVDASQPPISVTPDPINFGEQIAGTTSAVQVVTYQNNTTVDVEITNVSLTGANPGQFIIVADTCNGNLLPPGSFCQISIAFAPTTNGNRSATLLVHDTALGSPREVSLSGTGLPPAPVVCLGTAGPLVFTNLQAVGTSSSPQTITITNCGTADLNIFFPLTVTGSGSNDFSTAGETCTAAAIPPGGTCDIPVVFTPVTAGLRQGILEITHDADGSLSQITLQGTGFVASPSICLSRTNINFGAVAVGSVTLPQSVIVTNCGTADLTVSGVDIVGTHASDFNVTSNTCGLSAITTGSTCRVFVNFAPTEGGVRNAFLAITNAASGTPQLIPLTGTGLPAALCLSTAGPVTFTNTAVNTTNSTPITVTITNCGAADLVISSLTFTGSGSNDFFVATNQTCTVAGIPGNGTCTIPIFFKPVATGLRQATLNIAHNANGGLAVISVRGTGFTPAPAVCLSRTTITFSNQLVGTTSGTESVTVTNCGTDTLIVLGVDIVGANPGDFAIFSNSCDVVDVGQNCKVFVTFTPTTNGLRTATLAITNTAAGSPRLVTLRGGGDQSQPDGLGGRYSDTSRMIGFNIVNLDATNQTTFVRVRRGRGVYKLYIAAHNAGTLAERTFIQGDGGTNGWVVRYFLGAFDDDVEVTEAVTNGTYATSTLATNALQGDATMLRMEVFPRVTLPRGATTNLFVTFTSEIDPSKQDRIGFSFLAR